MENGLRQGENQCEPDGLGVLGVFGKGEANPEMNNPHDLTFEAEW